MNKWVEEAQVKMHREFELGPGHSKGVCADPTKGPGAGWRVENHR